MPGGPLSTESTTKAIRPLLTHELVIRTANPEAANNAEPSSKCCMLQFNTAAYSTLYNTARVLDFSSKAVPSRTHTINCPLGMDLFCRSGAHPEFFPFFFFFFGGEGGDPDATYNLCLILKIMF
jgi:hypothetical protein